MDYPNWFVVLMGIGVVFFGLIILIIAVKIMGVICGATEGKAVSNTTADAGKRSGGAMSNGPVPSDLVAAVSAVIAEEMGIDVSAIRIKSIKRV